jgi:hypothetical protein
MTLRAKLTFLFLVLAVCPLTIVAAIAYHNSRQAIEQETFHHLVPVNTSFVLSHFSRMIAA